jgi:hypothetical protein
MIEAAEEGCVCTAGEGDAEPRERGPRNRARGRGRGDKADKAVDSDKTTPETVSETTSNRADDGMLHIPLHSVGCLHE